MVADRRIELIQIAYDRVIAGVAGGLAEYLILTRPCALLL